MPDRNLPIGRDLIKDHMEQTFRIRELINALSYDVCLRICSYNLAVLLSRIMSNAIQKEPIGDDWSNLQKIKKVRSEEHTSELQSLMRISYAVFCLKKKKTKTKTPI